MNLNLSETVLKSDKIHQLVFGWMDYCLFTGLLGVSLIIGVYFGFFSKQNSKAEYLFGGKTMDYFPVAVSILSRLVIGISICNIMCIH